MNKENVSRLISQIETNLAELRKELGALEEPKLPRGNAARKRGKRNKKKAGSTKPIEGLIASGFFKQAKTDLDVMGALKKKALSFDREDVAVTLMRFVRKGIMEREGDGTKKNPWGYKKIL